MNCGCTKAAASKRRGFFCRSNRAQIEQHNYLQKDETEDHPQKVIYPKVNYPRSSWFLPWEVTAPHGSIANSFS